MLPLEYPIKKFPLPIKGVTIILLKVESDNELLRMLLVLVCRYKCISET